MKDKLLRISLEQCSSFLEMVEVARDVGASSDELFAVLGPREVRLLNTVYSPFVPDGEWAKARKELSPFADSVYSAVSYLRGSEDKDRVERGERPQWEEAYAFIGKS